MCTLTKENTFIHNMLSCVSLKFRSEPLKAQFRFHLTVQCTFSKEETKASD